MAKDSSTGADMLRIECRETMKTKFRILTYNNLPGYLIEEAKTYSVCTERKPREKPAKKKRASANN